MAVAEQESNHRYDAVGPKTKNGDMAYGKYQIMGRNIGPWTQEYLGIRMTIDKFLEDHLAQDKLAGIIFTQRIGQYQNTHDPIAMWFSGQPLAGNIAKDVTGTTVPEYVARVLQINTALAAE